MQEWVEGTVDLGVFPPTEVPQGWVAVVDARTADGPVTVVAHRTDEPTLRIILFDAVSNNADRKGGHLLRTTEGLYGIDHGVTFHTEPKLRTVLWGLAGEAIPAALLDQLHKALPAFDALDDWLSVEEVRECRVRAESLSDATFPSPVATGQPCPGRLSDPAGFVPPAPPDRPTGKHSPPPPAG